jgi:hypothetical protein
MKFRASLPYLRSGVIGPWDILFQFKLSNNIRLGSILLLSYQLLRCFSTGLCPCGFSTKILLCICHLASTSRFSFCILFDWSPLYVKGINHGASHFATFSWALCCWTSLVSSCQWNYRHCLSPQIRNSQRFRGCICHRFHLEREEGRISWGLSSLQGLKLVLMTFPPALVLRFSRSIWRRRPVQLPKHKFLICGKVQCPNFRPRLWLHTVFRILSIWIPSSRLYPKSQILRNLCSMLSSAQPLSLNLTKMFISSTRIIIWGGDTIYYNCDNGSIVFHVMPIVW